jgi:hypothetical protein
VYSLKLRFAKKYYKGSKKETLSNGNGVKPPLEKKEATLMIKVGAIIYMREEKYSSCISE